VAAVAHLALALSLVFGILQAGGRYFYCEALGFLPFDPCTQAHGATGKSPVGTLSEQHTDCCEVVTLGATPSVVQAADRAVAPAPWVALVPAHELGGPIACATPPSVDRCFKRWRPPPRAPNDARAQLNVFLI